MRTGNAVAGINELLSGCSETLSNLALAAGIAQRDISCSRHIAPGGRLQVPK
jgi:hypothetical protein